MLRLDIRWGLVVAVLVLAMAAHASAQRLMETDGIELLGSVRVVTDAAATCNVVEASHTEAAYERIQANHGQPLDVWQLDFSVYNGSGRWLDHLIARYGIEAKWPDCTNWSGDGPGGGPTGTYSEPVLWASTIGRIQETGRNVVAPGATLTATTFILSFHEDAPRFANWSVDFTFGDPVTAGGAETEAAESAGAGRGVPAEIGRGNERGGVDAPAVSEAQENLFWQSIMNSTNPSEFEVYLDQFPNGVFRALAETRLAALRAPVGDRPSGGVASPPGSAPPAATDQGQPSRIRAEQTCAGQPQGDACWMAVANHPECYVWNPSLQPDETVTWTGECAGGLAQGTGTLNWVSNSDRSTSESTGFLQEGQRHGDWVLRFADGTVEEGPYVEGKMHGDWVERWADGTVHEGPYVEDQRHGDWVLRFADGTVRRETFVNGEWIN